MGQDEKDVVEYTERASGPTSIVLVGVHGDEPCGIKALEKILPTLVVDKGKVIFIVGNPKAVKKQKRFIGSNLNRMFKPSFLLSKTDKKSYEYKRANLLKAYFKKADVLLDVHSSHTKGSEPFAICEANAKNICKLLPVKLVVSGFDAIQPGGTDYYMNKIGKVGICVECGYSHSFTAEKNAKTIIKTFLVARGHIKGKSSPQKQSQIYVNKLYITKNNFKLTKKFKDFEKIYAGQTIGIDGKKEIKTETDSIILFARNRDSKNEEAFILGK